MVGPGNIRRFIEALPSQAEVSLPNASLLDAAIDRIVLKDRQLNLYIYINEIPLADDLIALEEQLGQCGIAPAVSLFLRFENNFEKEEQAVVAAELFGWMIASLRAQNGFLSLMMSNVTTQVQDGQLLLLVPQAFIGFFTNEVLDKFSDFMLRRVGFDLSFCIRVGEFDEQALIDRQLSDQQQNLSLIRQRLRDSREEQQRHRIVGEDGEPVLSDVKPNAKKKDAVKQASPAAGAPELNGPVKRPYRKQAEGHLWGKVNSDLSVTPIRTFSAESSYVQMEGFIHNMEVREVSNGTRILYKFSVYDVDGAINCVMFARLEEKAQLDDLLCKKKAYYRFEAEISYDARYAKDLQAMVRGICQAEEPTGRKDTWPEKRVELHCHTKMSSKDAVSDVSDIVQLAADFGHPAVAITDHGVVQSFPEACDTRDALRKKGKEIKLIYGVEGYLIDDGPVCVYGLEVGKLGERFVSFDLETTGLDPSKERIIEIGAVRYERGGTGVYTESDSFSCLINPGKTLDEKIVSLTGLTDMDLAMGENPSEAIRSFHKWLGTDPVVGHNVLFDLSFLRYEAFRAAEGTEARLKFNPVAIDTLPMSRHFLDYLKRHKLDTVARELDIEMGSHHRATDDAKTAAQIFLILMERAGQPTLAELNAMLGRLPHDEIISAKRKPNHIIFLVKDEVGLYNLYRLISESHTKYYRRRPRVPRALLDYFRSGLIIGAACEAGEIFQYVHKEYLKAEHDFERAARALGTWPAKKLARYYDYLEIQPLGNNRFMLHKENTGIDKEQDLINLNLLIIEMAKAAKKPVVATCDAHFLNESDGIYRQVMQAGIGFDDTEEPANLYFRSTDEMLKEFSYLGPDMARECVISAPNQIAAMVEDDLRPFPAGTFPPVIDEAADMVTQLTWDTARKLYEKDGKLPEVVTARVEKELGSIIDNGFAIMYYISHKLVKKSNEDGYIVGSRGSVGSSLVATLCGITEVNPLPAHYYCPDCQYTYFYEPGEFGSGYDMEAKACPDCGTELIREGQDIPFETFLGFKGDKQPDIDLNFSGEYQPKAHRFIEDMFGDEHTYRAGTIGAYAEKNALGLVLGYLDQGNRFATEAEKKRLAEGLVGVKRTTGQHPGGIVVIPKDREIYDFTPIQYPADKADAGVTTTHFDFNAMHDTILKLDILGHDDPTMLKFLYDETGINPMDIPIPDATVMSLFQSTKALGIEPGSSPADCASIGIPEMGTFMARDMIRETQPSQFYDLVQLMGLSHGTDVWKGNAQDLILNGICGINDVIGCRDTIMTSLLHKGLPAYAAFDIMEKVRKGKGVSEEYETLLREHDVEEWYIDSCKKIKYMFPKAHAVAYVMSSLRIAWYKVNYPEAYYAAYFTVRADEFDYKIMCGNLEHTIRERERLRESFNSRDKTAREQRQYYITELVEEMLYRDIRFLPISLYESDASRFLIADKGLIRPPLDVIQNFSTAMGMQVVQARKNGEFKSKEDLANRAGLGQSAIQYLSDAGVLEELPDSAQMDFFSFMSMG